MLDVQINFVKSQSMLEVDQGCGKSSNFSAKESIIEKNGIPTWNKFLSSLISFLNWILLDKDCL